MRDESRARNTTRSADARNLVRSDAFARRYTQDFTRAGHAGTVDARRETAPAAFPRLPEAAGRAGTRRVHRAMRDARQRSAGARDAARGARSSKQRAQHSRKMSASHATRKRKGRRRRTSCARRWGVASCSSKHRAREDRCVRDGASCDREIAVRNALVARQQRAPGMTPAACRPVPDAPWPPSRPRAARRAPVEARVRANGNLPRCAQSRATSTRACGRTSGTGVDADRPCATRRGRRGARS